MYEVTSVRSMTIVNACDIYECLGSTRVPTRRIISFASQYYVFYKKEVKEIVSIKKFTFNSGLKI